MIKTPKTREDNNHPIMIVACAKKKEIRPLKFKNNTKFDIRPHPRHIEVIAISLLKLSRYYCSNAGQELQEILHTMAGF
jgi:hypothetical protein